MKIIIYGLNFKPELVGVGKYSGELADFLNKKGNKLRVITAPKYYPEWKSNKNKYLLDNNNPYRVYRCPIYIPKYPNGIKRIILLISFAITSFPILLSQLFWRPDCIILIAPTVSCALNVFFFKFLSFKKVFTMLHIQDFELEAAFNLGILNGKLFKKYLAKIELIIFKNFQVVGTISQGMIKKLFHKGLEKEIIYFLPNWVDLDKIKPIKLNERNKYRNKYRKKFGISDKTIVIQYSGSMNKKQGFDFILPIIEHFNKTNNLLWLFGGDGPMKNTLIKATKNTSNIIFLPLQDEKDMNEWLNTGDIHIIPQDDSVEELLFPSKLITILASGNPVVSNANENTELGQLVAEVGIRVNPKDQVAFINALNELIVNKNLRFSLGKKARQIACKFYNKDLILEKFDDFLKKEVFKK